MSSSLLLDAILLLLVVEPFIVDRIFARWVFDVLVSGVLVAAVWRVGRRRALRVSGLALAVPALASKWLIHAVERPWLETLALVLALALLVFTVVVLLRGVLGSASVSSDTIADALSAYLLLAVVWALTFALIELAHPGSFQIGGQPFLDAPEARRAPVARLMYLSLVTLATLGYGDVLPVTPVARQLAALEAVVGQLYLAVLIARLVALRATPPSRPAG